MTRYLAGIKCTLIPNICNLYSNTPHVGILIRHNDRLVQGVVPRILWEAALDAKPKPISHEEEIQQQKDRTQADNEGSTSLA